jgi:hypothetical protein
MKKVLTIIIAAILLASGMKVSLDRHYCGGNLVDVRISFTGKLASCGMEPAESVYTGQATINNKCCEDQLSFYSLNSKYYPEYFKFSQLFSERDLPPVYITKLLAVTSFSPDSLNWVFPPGVSATSALTQSQICVFRI